MSANGIIQQKSFHFAVKTTRFCRQMISEKRDFVLVRQLFRAGTSVGANIREAENGVSKPDFLNKMGIAQKECDESIYWMEVMLAAEVCTESELKDLIDEAKELLRIIRSIILSTKRNMKNDNS